MRYDITARCGSRIYHLEHENSNYDCFTLVSGPNASIYEPDFPYHILPVYLPEEDNYLNRFTFRTDSFYSIHMCANALISPLYDKSYEGESQILKDFWNENSYELAEISPYITYSSSITEVTSDIENKRSSKYSICARMIGLMWCRYYSNHIFSARDHLTREWKNRYWLAKAGKVTEREVKSWLDEITTQSFKDFYLNQPVNTQLHDEYKKVLDKVLEESPIT